MVVPMEAAIETGTSAKRDLAGVPVCLHAGATAPLRRALRQQPRGKDSNGFLKENAEIRIYLRICLRIVHEIVRN